MKKFLAIILALVMVMSLAACSGGSADDSGASKDKGLEDKWVWTINVGGELMNVPEFKGTLSIVMDIEFQDGGKLTMELDDDKLKDSLEGFQDDLIEYMVQLGSDEATAKSIVEQMDLYTAFSSQMTEMEYTGTYTVDGDKLTMTTNGKDEIFTYQLDGDTLKLTPEDDEGLEALETLGVDCMELKRAS